MADRDNVAADLLQILRDCGIEATKQDLLMQKLCSFVSRRDSKLFNHAYKVGQEKLKAEVRGRLEEGFPKTEFRQEYPGNEKTQDNQKEK